MMYFYIDLIYLIYPRQIENKKKIDLVYILLEIIPILVCISTVLNSVHSFSLYNLLLPSK